MFAGLNIGMAAFRYLHSLHAENGCSDALVGSGVALSGTAEYFMSAFNLARTYKMHQVTDCCLFKFLLDANRSRRWKSPST